MLTEQLCSSQTDACCSPALLAFTHSHFLLLTDGRRIKGKSIKPLKSHNKCKCIHMWLQWLLILMVLKKVKKPFYDSKHHFGRLITYMQFFMCFNTSLSVCDDLLSPHVKSDPLNSLVALLGNAFKGFFRRETLFFPVYCRWQDAGFVTSGQIVSILIQSHINLLIPSLSPSCCVL